jgi:hypothetical protein
MVHSKLGLEFGFVEKYDRAFVESAIALSV